MIAIYAEHPTKGKLRKVFWNMAEAQAFVAEYGANGWSFHQGR